MKRIMAVLAMTLSIITSAAAQAPATNSNAQAKELAQRLGRERNAEGLETILKTRNLDLLDAYMRGSNDTGSKRWNEERKLNPIPADIEALMLRYYAEPVVGGRLVVLCSNATACQTRELFDLMLADWRSKKAREFAIKEAVLRSQAPGTSEALTRWLEAADAPTGDALNSTISELGQRKYAPAVPALAKALAKTNAGGPRTNATSALGQIGTADAAEALLVRLAVLKKAPVNEDNTREAIGIVGNLTQFAVPVSYARVGPMLPESAPEYATYWLDKRKDLAAVPDVLLLLGDSKHYPRALDALVATDSPEVWKQARVAVEKAKQQGRMGDGQYRFASQRLDEKIANPAKHAAEQKALGLEREFSTHYGLLQKDLNDARRLKDPDPAAYVKAVREYAAAMIRLAASYPGLMSAQNAVASLGQQYLELGHFVRFRQKDTRGALELYAAAQARGAQLSGLAIADTYQFDLRDKQKALAEYRKLLEPAPVSPYGRDEQAALKAWAQRWIAAQVANLETGKKFSGALSGEEVAVAQFLVGGPVQSGDPFGLTSLYNLARGGGKPVDRAEIERRLSALPPSTFALLASISYASYLPDARSILAFLARHDPAGFATAIWFALLDMVDAKPEARGYAEAFAPGMSAGASDPLRVAR
ncbi:MAG: hypothetical protein ABI669_11710, partial [Usitatibacter sp.]